MWLRRIVTLSFALILLRGVGEEQASRCDFSVYKPVRVSDWLPRGIVKQVTAAYPPDAKLRGISGRVFVKVLIDKNGDVVRACAQGPAVLRRAAEDAALKWKFNTPTLNGKEKFPYLQDVVTFDFVIDDSSSKSSR